MQIIYKTVLKSWKLFEICLSVPFYFFLRRRRDYLENNNKNKNINIFLSVNDNQI